jgi:hypothetical protein
MADGEETEDGVIAGRLRQQAITDRIRLTVHAHQEMVEEDIALDDVRDVLLSARLLEDYPEHRRGACCLFCGYISRNRYVHVVCTTALDLAIIITVHEPRPPKWVTPFERGGTE